MSEERPSWGFQVGDEIVPGREALESLGGGRRYEAYLAWDAQLLTTVVVKILRPDRVGDEKALKKLTGERNLLSSLAHPIIVRCFDAVLGGPRPHLVLEHIEGVRLSSHIKRGDLLPTHIARIGLRLASALHYLAANQIVHLDVKPGNIVVGANPRLIDFSIARTVDEAKHIRKPIGTDLYMAPEQCVPQEVEISAPADIWGLGATMYEALASRVPFPRKNGFEKSDVNARFPQLRSTLAELPSTVDQSFAKAVTSCLEKDQLKRPTAAELAMALEPLAAAS